MTMSARNTHKPDQTGRDGFIACKSGQRHSNRRQPAVVVGISSIALLAAGHFALAALQGNTATSDLPGGDNHSRSIAVGDLDCDAVPDVIVANEDGEANQIYWGNGDGTFQNPIPLADQGTTIFTDDSDAVDLADVDQDGDLDLVIGNRQSSVVTRVYRNDCNGDFVGVSPLAANRRTADAQFADVNGDGDPDVVVANRGAANWVYPGDNVVGGTAFGNGDNLNASANSDSSSIAVGDLDGNGAPEIIIGNRENTRNDLYINLNDGSDVPFGLRRDLSTDANYTDWVEIADLNNDGFNDVIIANREQPNQFLLNKGADSTGPDDLFNNARQISADDDYTRELRVADVDNDGDVDVITANDAEDFNKIYLNLFVETGGTDVSFSAGIAYTPDTLESTSIAVCDPAATPACDLDGDGDIDILTANNTNVFAGITVAPNQVHINNNESPIIVSTPVTGAAVGELYEYTILAEDPDFGQTLEIPLGSATFPAWITGFDSSVPRQLTVSGTPQAGDVGANAVSFVVSDGDLQSAPQSFNIDVAAANSAPTFTMAPPALFNAEQGSDFFGITTFTVNVAASDAEDAPGSLGFTAPNAPGWVSVVNNNNGSADIIMTPGQHDLGTHTIIVRVTDTGGRVAEQTMAVTVTDGNDRPIAGADLICLPVDANGIPLTDPVTTLGLPTLHPWYGEELLTWNDYDIDGDTVTATGQVTLNNTTGTVVVNTDGTFSFTPSGAATDAGDRFRYAITDGNNGNNRPRVDVRLVTDAECQPDNNAAPIITVDPIDLQIAQGDAWDDTEALMGVTASDAEDGDITANIVVSSNPVDPNTPGDYVVTYDVDDSEGKAAQTAIRNVSVVSVDVTPPVITLTGAAVVDLVVGDTYVEEGATATDDVDGDISANIVIGGDVVDTTTAGTYTVTYNVSDAAGNAATEVTRTVNVAADTTPPVITLNGDAVIDIVVGGAYNELGATATDNQDGDISANIVIGGDAVDTNTVGTYVVTYNVSDSSGNAAAEVIRTVRVTSGEVPVIMILGDNPATVDQGATYSDAGATAMDAEDGDLTGSIVVDDQVDTSTPGTYTVTYTVTDSTGNTTNATRNVTVQAGEVPVITILGANPATVTQGTTYSDAGATAADAEDGDLTAAIVTNSTVNTGVAGSYTVTYTVTDSAGNTVSATRNVTVQSSGGGGGNTGGGGGGGGGATSLAELLVMMLLITIAMTSRRLRLRRRSTW